MSPPINWTFEPSVLVGMLALALAYGYAWRAARAPGEPHPPGYGRLALFCAGELTIAVALISPLDGFARYLLVMHMTQHVLLLDIVPILLILSLTKGILRPVAREVKTLEERAGFVATPTFAMIAYVSAMWFWHIPAIYDLALRYNNVHILEHLSFSTAGTLYWWHLISPIRSHMRFGGMGPVAYMVATKLLVGVLGVGLAFSPTIFYPWYAHQPHWWNLTAVEDQNLAGLVMALEQSVVMGIALAFLFVRMLVESEREAQRQEKYQSVV